MPHASSKQPLGPQLKPSRSMPGAALLPLLLYRSLFPVAFLGMLPSFAKRMLRRGNYRHKFGQRFGVYSQRARTSLQPGGRGGWTWIHAVSVGEMMMAVRLARTLEAEQPGQRILLSTTTSTGYALARSEVKAIRREWAERGGKGGGEAASAIELIYYPLDFAPIVRRVLDMVRPRQIILVDKEFWPNMVVECYRRRIPISIVNAMLSPRSEGRFLKWRRWVGPFFSMLEKVCVQEPEDVGRWQALGVRAEALECTGSLKFDFQAIPPGQGRNTFPQELMEAWGLGNASVILGGSTFAGEEEMLVEIYRQLRSTIPELFLILVPRHVERRGEIRAMLERKGVSFCLRSEVKLGGAAEVPARPEVLLVDTTGELRDWYRQASVCYIGKSLTPVAKGGQNPAEPILVGRPVVFGPWMQNFASLVRQFLAVGGATQVQDADELRQAIEVQLADVELGRAQVARARAVLEAHAGANKRVAKWIIRETL